MNGLHYDAVLYYQRMIVERFAKGCDVQQNTRPFIPESKVKVDHVHWHLKPRNPGDELQLATQGQSALWQDLTPEYMERFKALYLD